MQSLCSCQLIGDDERAALCRGARLDESRRRSVGDGRTEGNEDRSGDRRRRFTERNGNSGRGREYADRAEQELGTGRTPARHAAMGSRAPMERAFAPGMSARRTAVRRIVRGGRGRSRCGGPGATGRHGRRKQQRELQRDQRQCTRREPPAEGVHLKDCILLHLDYNHAIVCLQTQGASLRPRSQRHGVQMRCFVSGILLCVLAGSASAEPTAKNVVLLFSDFGQRTNFLDLFEASLRAQVPGPITFYEAYMEYPQKGDASYLQSEADTLQRRYSGLKLDAVVVAGPSALQFALQYRDTIFPGVPIAFTGLATRQFAGRTWPGVTGLTTPVGLGKTIDLALRLQPDTTTVAVIAPKEDPYWLAATHTELLRYRDRVKEAYFYGPANRELFEKVTALPGHTIVLFHLAPPSSGQPALAGLDLIDAIAERMPTYSAWRSLCFGHGCIGGAYEDNAKLTLQFAEMTARLLAGERPESIPIVNAADLTVQVDWRALQRWHIPESFLPEGSAVLNREPSLWQRGRRYFIAGAAVILLQSVLISALFWQRTQKKKTESALRQSEQKFSKSFRHSPLAVTITTMTDARYVEVNETFEEQTGWQRQEVIGRTPFDLHLWENPDQRVSMVEQLRTTGHVRDLEFRVRRKDGERITVLGSAEVIDVDGEPCALSVAADITERKLAEEALAGVGRKLIEAQEAERTHIARELHDDINQRIALLALNLHMLRKALPPSEITTSKGIDDAYKEVASLGADIQALFHRLHSSGLEYLGLEAAVTGFCREISERRNLKIRLRVENLPDTLPYDISLCLFRVLQEAVHNALKYSGAGECDVSLTGTSTELQLIVRDSGAGFDPAKVNGHGLGLTSMRERLRLVKGQLSIEARPQHGTTIRANVPVIEVQSSR
jgi:PAS domain S-box-containing protein